MAYYRIIYTDLSHGVTLYGCCSNTNITRTFTVPKEPSDTSHPGCRATGELVIDGLGNIYSRDTASISWRLLSFFKSKCNLIRGSYVHSFVPRDWDNYRIGRHRAVVDKQLISSKNVKVLSKVLQYPRQVKLV